MYVKRAEVKMSISKTIVLSSVIIALSILISGRFEVMLYYPYVVRLDRLTGAVELCSTKDFSATALVCK